MIKLGGKMKKKWKISLMTLAAVIVLFEVFSIISLLKTKSEMKEKIRIIEIENSKKEKNINDLDNQIKKLKMENEDLKKAKGDHNAK